MPSSYGVLGTYPPTRCGVASFTRALCRHLTAQGDRIGIVRVLDGSDRSSAPEVVGYLHPHARVGAQAAAEILNTFDVALIQHDVGIYGGADGEQVLSVLDHLCVPAAVVVHTVSNDPSAHHASVLHRVIAASDAVVTLTYAARRLLIERYQVDPAKVHAITHSATLEVPPGEAVARRRPLILTWGVLRPGRGIEWAIDGLQGLRSMRPLPAYIVAGQTDPRVRLHDGESYRLRLAQRARIVGVEHLFRSVGTYVEDAVLARLIRRADIVLLPYDSGDQAASPVLVEAVAAGKPVVATAFPHAVELLSGGAGLLVPHHDGAAVGTALRRVLTEPGLAEHMAAEAARLAPTFSWPVAAARYRSLAAGLISNRSKRHATQALAVDGFGVGAAGSLRPYLARGQ